METVETLESQINPDRLSIQSDNQITTFEDPTQE